MMSNNTTGETLLDMQEANNTPTTLYAIKKSDTRLDPASGPEPQDEVAMSSVGFDRLDPTVPTAVPDPAESRLAVSDLDAAPTAITTICHERYEFLALLGRGSHADVHKVRDRRLSKPWRDVFAAVKSFHGAGDYGADARMRIHNEVLALRDIKHENVCQVYDILDWDDEHPAIVMEYIEGKNLLSIIKSGADIDLFTAASWGADIALGLAAIHDKEIIHRDVKPANVMIKGRNGSACLLDLGVAKFRDDVTLTQRGVALGTPLYMAPEQLDGLAHPTSDLYALGLIIGLILTGEVPLSGDRSVNAVYRLRVHEQRKYRLKDHAPGVPQGLCDIVDRMLEFSPAARYPTGADVAEALNAFIADAQAETRQFIQPIPAPEIADTPAPIPPPRPRSDTLVRRKEDRRPVLLLASAFVALAIALMIIMMGALARAEVEVPPGVPPAEQSATAFDPKAT